MSIRHVKVSELTSFSAEVEATPDRYPVVPITTARAKAQAGNPVAKSDDVALVVAYEDKGRCVGYLGIVPCQLWTDHGTDTVYALSTFFVDPGFRGQPYAGSIMREVIGLGYDLLLSGYSPSARRFYEKHPEWFEPCPPAEDFSMAIRPLSILVSRQNCLQRSQRFSRLSKILLSVSRSIDTRIMRTVQKQIVNKQILKTFEVETKKVHPMGSKRQTGPHFVRSFEVVNWMINNCWITEECDRCVEYFFSSSRRLFKFRAFDLFDSDSRDHIGFVVFQISREEKLGRLKILDVDLDSSERIGFVVELAMRVAAQWQIELIEGSRDILSAEKSLRWFRLTTRIRERGNFVHIGNPKGLLAYNFEKIKFHYCDGDSAFT